MPLIKSPSNKARSENIRREISAGKKPAVAEAIAYSVQRETRKKQRKPVRDLSHYGDHHS